MLVRSRNPSSPPLNLPESASAIPPVPPSERETRQDSAAVQKDKAQVAQEEARIQSQKAQSLAKQPIPHPPAPVPPPDLKRPVESQTAEGLRPNSLPNESPSSSPRATAPVGPLNPALAAKLRVDASRLPDWVGLVVRMDGEILVQRAPRTEPGKAPNLDEILIPAGEHEFRVFSGVSAARVGVSNIVSADFAAGKKRTLKIEVLDASGRGLRRSAKQGVGHSLFITIK